MRGNARLPAASHCIVVRGRMAARPGLDGEGLRQGWIGFDVSGVVVVVVW
jgi:hypothetical protein